MAFDTLEWSFINKTLNILASIPHCHVVSGYFIVILKLHIKPWMDHGWTMEQRFVT